MTDSSGTEKDPGTGPDGTIPDSEDGLAVGVSGDASHFNQEEDASDAGSDDGPDDDAPDSDGSADAAEPSSGAF